MSTQPGTTSPACRSAIRLARIAAHSCEVDSAASRPRTLNRALAEGQWLLLQASAPSRATPLTASSRLRRTNIMPAAAASTRR
eukprot:2239650-Pleurochrysis_carterae.AAC.1